MKHKSITGEAERDVYVESQEIVDDTAIVVAGGGIKRLFEAPLVVGTAEGRTDLSGIITGERGELVDEAVEEVLRSSPRP